MQCSIFNWTFKIVIYDPTTSNNCSNVVPVVLLLYSDTPGVTLNEEQPYIAQFPLGIINWKHQSIKIKISVFQEDYQKEEYSCFDFLAYPMFTFDVFWGSLGISIFGNSSSAANNTWSRLQSRLSFCFLWLWVRTMWNILDFEATRTMNFENNFTKWYFMLFYVIT